MRTTTSLILIAGLLAGCTEDTVPTVDTKVDKGQPVTQLDPATEDELCDDLAEFAAEFYNRDLFISLACISVAIQSAVNPETGTFDEGTCDQAFRQCQSDPPPEVAQDVPDTDASQYSCELDQIPADCNITVGDLVACTEEAARFLDEYVNNFSCTDLEQSAQQTEVGEACSKVERECPGLFTDEAPTGDPPPQ